MYVSQKRKAHFLFSKIVVLVSNGINGPKKFFLNIIKHIYFMVDSKGGGGGPKHIPSPVAQRAPVIPGGPHLPKNLAISHLLPD